MDYIPQVLATLVMSIERFYEVMEVSLIVGTAVGGLWAGTRKKSKSKGRQRSLPINSQRP